MIELAHFAVVATVLVLWPTHLPWVLVASTVVYGVAKARAEAFERANGWRRMVVSK